MVRIRLLPVVILIGALLISFKAYDIGRMLKFDLTSIDFDVASSSRAAPQASNPARIDPPQTKPNEDSDNEPVQILVQGLQPTKNVKPEQHKPVSLAQNNAAPRAAPGKPTQVKSASLNLQDRSENTRTTIGRTAKLKLSEFLADPSRDLTIEEITLLQSLANRRAHLVRRERQLSQNEAILRAAEQRVDEKIIELRSLQAQIEGLLTQHETEKRQQINRLVNIYSAMKPKDAATVFRELEIPIVVELVEIMKERKAAPIIASLSKVDAIRAKKITEELAQRRDLPIPKE